MLAKIKAALYPTEGIFYKMIENFVGNHQYII